MDFEYGFKGTSVENLFEIFKTDKKDLIVFDYQYGTSFSLNDLKNSKYISNLCYKKQNTLESKDSEELDAFKNLLKKCLIESNPRLFDLEFVTKIYEYDSLKIINFISINEHFVIKDKIFYKIPYNEYDIATSNWLTPKDKLYLYRFIKNEISYFELQQKTKPIVCEILNSAIINENCKNILPFYLSKFNTKNLFFYPIYGEKEISDQLSRVLAFQNVAFYIEKNISLQKKEIYELNGEQGTVTFKYLINSNQINERMKRISLENEENYNKKYIRIFICKEIKNCFFGVLLKNKNIYFIIRLNENCKVVPKNFHILYVYGKTEIPENILEELKIEEKDVLIDISFENKI